MNAAIFNVFPTVTHLFMLFRNIALVDFNDYN